MEVGEANTAVTRRMLEKREIITMLSSRGKFSRSIAAYLIYIVPYQGFIEWKAVSHSFGDNLGPTSGPI